MKNHQYQIKYKKSENSSFDSSSQFKYSFPISNINSNNIPSKNSVHLIKSDQKQNSHRQYLIDFIRDNNNNKNKKQNNQKISTKKSALLQIKEEENEHKYSQEIPDQKNFFNDYFNYKTKLEKNNYNKNHTNETLIDIIDYIGEEAFHPINIDLMNIKMNNFIPGKISSKSFGLINSYGANTNQGIDRNYNDDRVKIMINMNRPANYSNKSSWPLISYFGIFDGHNGEHCAEFLRKNLLQYIINNPSFPLNIEKSIKEAFLQADEDYLNNYSNINNECNNSGSCGLILLIIDKKIYIANVGDSRCVVSCQNGKIQKDVTRDHKPEFPYEKKRIYNNKGSIYRNETVFSLDYDTNKNKILLGPYRVSPGKLSVSRTIGDAKAKLEIYGGIKNVVIPEPDIYVYDLYKDDIDYFIMGCDGIFDRIKSWEIFRCVDTVVEKEKELINKNVKYNNSFNTCYDRKINMNSTCGNIVDIILRLSMIRKSYDNVTCIMVAFKDLIFGSNPNINQKKEHQTINVINSYDRSNIKYLKDKYGMNNSNKDILTSRYDNENRKNLVHDSSVPVYKKSDKNGKKEENKRYRNNVVFVDSEKRYKNQKSDKYENNKENEINNINNQNNKRNVTQSQEKKIRDLINLFSINNKQRPDNDNTSHLYNAYNSKNNINNTQRTRDNILFNNSNLDNNIKNNNINLSSIQESREKSETLKKHTTISISKKTPPKYQNISYLKSIQTGTGNKPSYFNQKNISKKLLNLKMNSFSSEDESDNFKNDEASIIYNQTNRIKSNSTENLYITPNKSDAYNKRIISRKIIRKTNNIFSKSSDIEDKLNNEKVSNNTKNNFFYSIILSSNKKDNEKYKSKIETINANDNRLNSQVNIRKINYEKYIQKNNNISYQKGNESSKDYRYNRYEKINNPKYEKNCKIQNENLPASSSLGFIYSKRRKNN